MAKYSSVKATAILILCFSIFLGLSDYSSAQDTKFSINFGGGGGYFQINDFIRDIEEGNTLTDGGRNFTLNDRNNLGEYLEFNIGYRLDDRSEITGTIGYMRTTSRAKASHTFIGGNLGISDEEWRISLVPIGLTFQYYMNGRNKMFTPVIGIGTSFSILNVTTKQAFNDVFLNDTRITNDSNTQVNMGLNAFIGLQTVLTERLFINTRVQAHYIPKMKLFDRDNNTNYKINLSGVNFTLGIGARL